MSDNVAGETVDRAISDVSELRAAQSERRRNFLIERVAEPEDWAFRDGALQHKSNGFFSVSGFRSRRDGREHLMLYQPQGAINGWLSRVWKGQRHYLVQARAEPGNVDGVQFGPTLQSTPANYLRLHGGKASPFAEHFLNFVADVTPVFETQQLDQGGRYVMKTKRVSLTEISHDPALPKGFHWVSSAALTAGAGVDFFLNTDFKAGLGLLPWGSDASTGELVPKSRHVRHSLAQPVRADVYGSALASIVGVPNHLDPVRLEDLHGWSITDAGIEPVTDESGVSVHFYKCRADAREVSAWTQPLLTASTPGLVVLACRVRSGVLEVRVGFSREVGLSTGSAFGATYMVYPGENANPPDWLAEALGTAWIETRESDEGGRFYDHWSRYALVMVADDIEVPEPGVWFNIAELKAALMASNVCTIQLRTIAALLLAAGDA